MKISILDGSNYFRGLLLLMRKDKEITDEESALMKRIGKNLGFEPEFCENAIRDILDNKYIQDEHPLFSSKELALKFIKDGITLALSDNVLHPIEEQWLKSTAQKNGIELKEFTEEIEKNAVSKRYPGELEADNLAIDNLMT